MAFIEAYFSYKPETSDTITFTCKPEPSRDITFSVQAQPVENLFVSPLDNENKLHIIY